MRKYAIRRFIQLIPILLGITLLSFILTNIGTTDVIDTMESNQGVVMSEEEKDQLRQEMGLDKPLAQQYVIWLGNVLRGDMGESFVSGKDVFDTFISKLPATIYLTVTSIFLTVLISIPLGILSAVKQNKFLDYLIRFLSFIGNSLPNFFVSLLLIYFFSLKLKLLPVMGNNSGWKSIILPTLTLAIAMSSKYTRQVRATVLEELNKDYVQGARAGSLLGGTAIVESIFMWDGVGKMAVDAITMRDYPIIQAYVIWMAVIYVVVNLITDLIYHYLDPRIRLGQEEA